MGKVWKKSECRFYFRGMTLSYIKDMTTYHSHGVKLSIGQKDKLVRALRNNSAITIRLSNSELTGPDQLRLTKKQINRLKKAMQNKTGADIKIRKTLIPKAVQQGGSLWSSLFKIGTRLLPIATKAVGPLATGALSGLANVGGTKIFGRGQVGGFLIPQNKIDQLIIYKYWLTEAQKKKIVNAIHTGGQIVIKPIKEQSGGFFGYFTGFNWYSNGSECIDGQRLACGQK